MKHNEAMPGISSLRETVLPDRDLWPEIESRLDQSRPRNPAVQTKDRHLPVFYRHPLVAITAMAASLVIGLAIGLALMTTRTNDLQWTQLVSNEYHAVRQQVLLNLDQADIDPEIAGRIKQNLNDIDRSVNQIIELLKKDPSNRELTHHLYEINRRRFEFLEAINTILMQQKATDVEHSI